MEKPESKLNLGIFFLSLIALVWINNAYIPLWNADEAAYAGMAKTMLDSGNGLVQDFFMSDVHRKPPLHLWLIALSYQIFGVNEWAVRFPSSLSILGGAWLIFSWMRSRFDQYTGQVAAGVFVSNFLILAMAKVAFVDAHLVFCVILLGISYFKISFEEFKVSDVVFYWLAIALGLLIKGPQIAVFTGLLFIGTFIIHRSWRPLLNIKPYIGLPLAVAPLLIWGYLSYQNDGGKMISWMWDWYVIKRIKGEAVFAQTGPPGYYLANIIAAFAPFFVGFSLIIKRIWKRGWSEDKWWTYTLVWALSGWLIYEIIPSKLPTYTIAAYPALSILIAYELSKVDLAAWKSLWMRLGIFIQMLLVAGISMALVYFVQAQFGFWGLLLAILAGLTILTTSIIYVLQLESDKFKRAGITLVWGNVLFAYLLLLPIMNNIIPIFECPKEVANSIQLDVKQSDNILLVKEDVHMVSLPFYLSREAELTQFRDRNESIQSANSIDYRAVIADSTFSQSLIEKYEPRDTFSCFDMNTGTNNQYIVFLLR